MSSVSRIKAPPYDIPQGVLTSYQKWRRDQNVPNVTGNYIEDIMDVKVGPWHWLGEDSSGAILNLGGQEETDTHLYEIPPLSSTNKLHHLYEAIFYVAGGRGKTVIEEKVGGGKVEFDWSADSAFSVPLNWNYQLFNLSDKDPARLLAGTTCPKMLNIFHNEDYIFRNPSEFKDRMPNLSKYASISARLGKRTWETNLIQNVNNLELDDWSEQGKGVKVMRFAMADNGYGCHAKEFPVGCRTFFHRHGAGAVVIFTLGEGYLEVFEEGGKVQRFEIRKGSIGSPANLMYHGYFNTGTIPLRHFAIRPTSPRYPLMSSQNSLYDMLPVDQEPAGIQEEYEDELKQKGIRSLVSIVND